MMPYIVSQIQHLGKALSIHKIMHIIDHLEYFTSDMWEQVRVPKYVQISLGSV